MTWPWKKKKNSSSQLGDTGTYQVTVNTSDNVNKDIFSADQARKMGIEIKNQKRIDNRMIVFRMIKQHIQYGTHKIQIYREYFDDGNDVYFEGLGYKITPVWVSSITGQVFETEPERNPTVTPTTWSERLISPPEFFNPMMIISWEK